MSLVHLAPENDAIWAKNWAICSTNNYMRRSEPSTKFEGKLFLTLERTVFISRKGDA